MTCQPETVTGLLVHPSVWIVSQPPEGIHDAWIHHTGMQHSTKGRLHTTKGRLHSGTPPPER